MIIFIDNQIYLLDEILSGVGRVYSFEGRKLTNKELKEKRCEFLFVRSTTKVNQILLEETSVRFVGTATSGIDHIDTDYLKKRNIAFAEAKGCNANSVAEYVIYSILSWLKTNNLQLSEQTIGIIGFGNIGTLVAKYSYLLGLKILVNDPPLLEKMQESSTNPFPNYTNYCELEKLLSEATIITNHVPLTETGKYPTKNLLNKENLKLLQNNALFIHTSRGGVVDEDVLLEMKREKKLTLVVDVWKNEPFINCKLLESSYIATPHIAGYSYDGKIRGTKLMVDAFNKFTGLSIRSNLLENELNSYKPLQEIYYKKPQLIFEKLNESRKIMEDFEQFKKILKIKNEIERGKYFDFLRINYPIRREIL
ncbi:MAG: 4-phosphoerythronate dehydrogenase [Ignavibacteria bacterium]|nr:4-phosphoerythronate dehydrogenase [Ignavibacteria bacterium]